MYRGFVLTAAARGFESDLQPFATSHRPLSPQVSCYLCAVLSKKPWNGQKKTLLEVFSNFLVSVHPTLAVTTDDNSKHNYILSISVIKNDA